MPQRPAQPRTRPCPHLLLHGGQQQGNAASARSERARVGGRRAAQNLNADAEPIVRRPATGSIQLVLKIAAVGELFFQFRAQLFGVRQRFVEIRIENRVQQNRLPGQAIRKGRRAAQNFG